MIKVELHVHSKGGSYCALASAKEIAARFSSEGYGAIMLTNHYSKKAFEDYPTQDFKGKMDYFFSLFEETKKECAEYGVKVFCGVEVATAPYGTEYILVGFDRDFLYDNGDLTELNQQQLFALAEKYNLFMYQAHPKRQGAKTGDAKFMHGAESFNSHWHHHNYNMLAEKFCKENNLIELSGNDFHGPDQPIIGGVLIPEKINDEKSLAAYLKSGKCKMIKKDEQSYQTWLRYYMESKK